MAYVTVDVDPCDLDTEDLVQEICRRLRDDTSRRKGLTKEQKAEIINDLRELSTSLGIGVDVSCKTIDDQMKLEVIEKYWNKYNSFEFERRLK